MIDVYSKIKMCFGDSEVTNISFVTRDLKMIWSFDDKGIYKRSVINNIEKTELLECYHLSVSWNKHIRVHGDLEVKTDSGFKKVKDLTEYDKIIIVDGNGVCYKPYKSYEKCQRKRVLYDIQTSNNDPYIVNGFVLRKSL